jgi:hypothetical protein
MHRRRGNKINIPAILAVLLLVFALAGPLSAGEKSFELTIPGCTA